MSCALTRSCLLPILVCLSACNTVSSGSGAVSASIAEQTPRQCMMACTSVTGYLNPVSGPLAQRTPRPAYRFQITGQNAGLDGFLAQPGDELVAKLEDGQVWKGNLRLIDPVDSASASSPDMQRAWDFLYGLGFYRASVLGNSLSARAVLTGPAGSAVLEIQNLKDPQTIGAAMDDKNNVYKVTFYCEVQTWLC